MNRVQGPGTVAAIFAFGVFATINYREWFREARCADCRYPHGIPFAYYREEAFCCDAGIAWIGLVGDILTCLVLMVVAALLTEWARGKLRRMRLV